MIRCAGAAGAQLVSVAENIDETPSGKLMHGILASMAEYYSRNLATEVMKGSVQKAQDGGTPFLAPIGYLNVRTSRTARTSARSSLTRSGLPSSGGPSRPTPPASTR